MNIKERYVSNLECNELVCQSNRVEITFASSYGAVFGVINQNSTLFICAFE